MSEDSNKQPREDIGEDLNIASILMIGLCYALVIAISMILLAALHNRKTRDETERKAALVGVSELEEARTQQAARIGSYEWIDYEAGVVRLPIERAMELAAERLAQGEPLGLAASPAPADDSDAVTANEIDDDAKTDGTSTGVDEEDEPASGAKE